MASKIARKPTMTSLLKDLLGAWTTPSFPHSLIPPPPIAHVRARVSPSWPAVTVAATPVAPPPPLVAARGPTWAVVRASRPRQGPGARRITSLEVQHGPRFGLSGWTGHDVDEGGWALLEGLTPNTSYVARARAGNGNGWGTASSRADFVTCKQGEPCEVEAGARRIIPRTFLPPEEEEEDGSAPEAAPVLGPAAGGTDREGVVEAGGGAEHAPAPSREAGDAAGPRSGGADEQGGKGTGAGEGISPGTFRTRLASWQGVAAAGGGDSASPHSRGGGSRARGPRRSSLGTGFASTFRQRLASWQGGGEAGEGGGGSSPPPLPAGAGPRVREVVAAWEARSEAAQPAAHSDFSDEGARRTDGGADTGGGAPMVPEEEDAALALCAASIPAEVPIEDVLAFLDRVVQRHGARGLAAHTETGVRPFPALLPPVTAPPHPSAAAPPPPPPPHTHTHRPDGGPPASRRRGRRPPSGPLAPAPTRVPRGVLREGGARRARRGRHGSWQLISIDNPPPPSPLGHRREPHRCTQPQRWAQCRAYRRCWRRARPCPRRTPAA